MCTVQLAEPVQQAVRLAVQPFLQPPKVAVGEVAFEDGIYSCQFLGLLYERHFFSPCFAAFRQPLFTALFFGILLLVGLAGI